MKSKKIALYGVMIATALILSYVEAQIPALIAIPGMKLGLTNLVVLTALYLMGGGAAFAINLFRILLVALLFGNAASLAFSAAGGILSTLVMFLLKKTDRFRMIPVSIAGGITHNVGQILVAMLLLDTASLAWYMAVLWFSGMVSGALVGLLGGLLCGRLEKILGKGGLPI